MISHSTLRAFGFNFAPLRELFSRKGAKEETGRRKGRQQEVVLRAVKSD
jgi:hypothetical protein